MTRLRKHLTTPDNSQFVQLIAEKGGDFFLELAVLTFVFVPLDAWRAELNWKRLFTVTLATVFFFSLGLQCHLSALKLRKERET